MAIILHEASVAERTPGELRVSFRWSWRLPGDECMTAGAAARAAASSAERALSGAGARAAASSAGRALVRERVTALTRTGVNGYFHERSHKQ